MLLRDIMTPYPITLGPGATARRAAELISASGTSDIMIVEGDHHFVGVLSEGDLLRSMLPAVDDVEALGGSLDDAFEFFIRKGAELADSPIGPLIIRDPLTVKPTDAALVAASILVSRNIRRLPVVQDGVLVGTISRADICRGTIHYAPQAEAARDAGR